jgi:hypothetical protein
MVQRVSNYERRERDTYETPEWVTQAILPMIPEGASIWEPACASGKMARALNAALATDLVTTYGTPDKDFLAVPELPEGITAIVTNPPFNREAEKFIRHGLKLLSGVPDPFMAMLLPIDFDSGKTRRDMFADCPLFAGKIVMTSRIIWIERPGASPTTNHAWYYWKKNISNPTISYHFRTK